MKLVQNLMFGLMLLAGWSCQGDYYTWIVTPNGSPILVSVATWDYSAQTLATWNDEAQQAYPDATLFYTSTRYFNCHAYAWAAPSYWLNSTRDGNWPNLEQYWTDGSHLYETGISDCDLTPEQEEILDAFFDTVRLHYSNADHSAIWEWASRNPTMAYSKWGAWPLMCHSVCDCPYYSYIEAYAPWQRCGVIPMAASGKDCGRCPYCGWS